MLTRGSAIDIAVDSVWLWLRSIEAAASAVDNSSKAKQEQFKGIEGN